MFDGQVTSLRKPTVSTRFVACDESAYQAALRLRHAVFYQASGMALRDVPDALEAESLHLVAEAGDQLCGYGRLTPQGEAAEISQMVVAESWRRQGVGSALLAALVETAVQQAALIHLSAQLDAVPFYERCGFLAVGEPHASDRLRIPVQEMQVVCDGPPSRKAFEKTRRSFVQNRSVSTHCSTPGRWAVRERGRT